MERFSSTMSRLGVGIGFGPQKEDSINMVAGEAERRPELLLLIEPLEETLDRCGPGPAEAGGLTAPPALTCPGTVASMATTDEVVDALLLASRSIRFCSLAASIILKL